MSRACFLHTLAALLAGAHTAGPTVPVAPLRAPRRGPCAAPRSPARPAPQACR